VASVATTIARALRLNPDLVAAMALGHDLGHAPFGHHGEGVLDALAQRKGLRFEHELHSLRIVDELDSPYGEHRGLNLTFAVRDGIACHHGEGFERELTPDRGKQLDNLTGMSRGSPPATPEGCVVRMADKLAYLGRDLEDALQAGLVAVSDIPEDAKAILGTDNRTIINKLVHDVVKNSDDSGKIAVSTDVHQALTTFYTFSIERIYRHEKVTQRFGQIDEAMKFTYERLREAIEKAKTSGAEEGDLFPSEDTNCFRVLADFLTDDVRNWRDEDSVRLTLDFIAGMTDSFFNTSFEELFLPTSSL
jgi:dGTPase